MKTNKIKWFLVYADDEVVTVSRDMKSAYKSRDEWTRDHKTRVEQKWLPEGEFPRV